MPFYKTASKTREGLGNFEQICSPPARQNEREVEEEAGRCGGQGSFSRCFSADGYDAGSTAQNLDGHFIPT